MILADSTLWWSVMGLAGIVFYAACVSVGSEIGQQNGRYGFSTILCVVLGPIGLAIACLLPRTPLAQARFELDRDLLRARIEHQNPAASRSLRNAREEP